MMRPLRWWQSFVVRRVERQLQLDMLIFGACYRIERPRRWWWPVSRVSPADMMWTRSRWPNETPPPAAPAERSP